MKYCAKHHFLATQQHKGGVSSVVGPLVVVVHDDKEQGGVSAGYRLFTKVDN